MPQPLTQGLLPSLSLSSECFPVDGLLPGFLEEFICLGEVPAAEKPSVDREGRGMNRLQDVVTLLGTAEETTCEICRVLAVPAPGQV